MTGNELSLIPSLILRYTLYVIPNRLKNILFSQAIYKADKTRSNSAIGLLSYEIFSRQSWRHILDSENKTSNSEDQIKLVWTEKQLHEQGGSNPIK